MNNAQNKLLDKRCSDLVLNDKPVIKPEERIYASDIMQEYADQQSVVFAEWCDNNATQRSIGYWFSFPLNIKSENAITTTELLNIFKNENNGK